MSASGHRDAVLESDVANFERELSTGRAGEPLPGEFPSALPIAGIADERRVRDRLGPPPFRESYERAYAVAGEHAASSVSDDDLRRVGESQPTRCHRAPAGGEPGQPS